MNTSVRIQEKGQVTIPTKIRKELNWRKGDLVTFIVTKEGLLVKPAEMIVSEALDKIGEALRAEGITLDMWIERSREIRAKMLEEEYGLKDENP